MNKKLLCLLISSFLLSGCANFKKINANELAAERDAQKATEYAKKIRNNPVIQDSTKQWINTTPIIEKQVKQSAPPCPIVINTRSDIELRQIAQRITQTCHIPVRISADVWTYLNGTGTGSTQQMTGSIPAPDANGMVPLASVGSQPVKVSSGGTSLPELNISGLPALLQTVSSRLGISWKYDKGRITFFYLETRSFPITYMDSNVAYNSKVVSGTMSSSGSTGSTSSGGMTGDASNTQTTTVEMKSSLYNDLKSEVSSMLTPGTGRMYLSTGSLTVTDTPDVLDSVQEIVNKRNNEMSRQVVLNVEILSIKKSSQQGEILSLRWEHVDLQHGVAHLPTTKNGAPRDVPLSRKARSYLQMLPIQLNGNIFSYTSSGFKSAWRTALQELKIENLHFHDLRHEAISRFFELGTLNVIEVAAISGHRSLNMLKRYTHLRAYQLVSKLDARRKQTSKIAPYFVPYPATVENRNGQVVVTLSDFDLETSAATKEQAIFHASVLLLRTLAQAAQRGERVPTPGELPTNIDERVMICPLTN